MPTPSLNSKTFWQYSVSLYATGDIAPIALMLQDNHKVNVNVLLLVCWCLQNNVIINLAQLNAVIKACEPSEATLKLHRASRKAAHPDKGGSADVYETLKKEELALERQQQEAMMLAFNEQVVATIPGNAALGANVFNASIAALINAYNLRDSQEARHLVSLLVNQLSK
jgi:uncharacterized protein (TIGR02444 family)